MHAVRATKMADGWDTTGIAFEDYQRINISVHKSAVERRSEMPPWATNDEQLQQVVARYMEKRALLKAGTGTVKQRLARAEAALRAQKAEHSETLTKLCKEYVAVKNAETPNRPRLRELEVAIENLDTVLRITDKGAALVFAVVYLYWRANQNSVYVSQELGIKPPHVRTLLHRLSQTWERMGNVVKRKPRRTPEELAAIKRGQEALAEHKHQQRKEERWKREAFAQELKVQQAVAWEAKKAEWAKKRAAKEAQQALRPARRRGTPLIHIPVGTRFVRLVVQGPPFVQRVQHRGRMRNYSFVPCLCDCGNRRAVRGVELRAGFRRRCGKGCKGKPAPAVQPAPMEIITPVPVVVPTPIPVVAPAPAATAAPPIPAPVWQPIRKRNCALPGCCEPRQRFTTVAFERVWLCATHMLELESGAIQIAVKNQSVVIREFTDEQA